MKRPYTWVETGTQGKTFLTNVVRNVDVGTDGALRHRARAAVNGRL